MFMVTLSKIRWLNHVKHSVQCFHMQKHSSSLKAKMRHHTSLKTGPDTYMPKCRFSY